MATLPLLAEAPPTEWQVLGSCQDSDTDVFFPPAHFEHKPERELREERAKAICQGCPVRTQCLEWALSTKEPHGIWGGYSESERKQILLGKLQVAS